MKRNISKLVAIGATVLTISLNSISIEAKTASTGMQFLTKYNTNEVILINNKPIEIPIYAQEKTEEFRGVWVSTVYNLDFSKNGLNEEAYKAEFRQLLNNLEGLNMNSVIFQVRPKLDAFYKSEMNPWSEFLTGKQGLDPGWDPLEWMVEETHKRGMEFHAWFNPYRVTVGSETLSDLAPNNWARQNPQYTYEFGGKLQLNPGEPEVIKYITNSIMEVVENYDIDAVHFDDYFYPFKSGDGWYSKEEETTFKKYGSGFSSRDDWRRNNVDTLIENIHNSIGSYNKNNNKNVQLGISPFGIWGHKEIHPEGSKEGVGSLTPRTSRASYDDQFADTRKWVKNNWIDYIAPQIYWSFDEKAAPYGELVNWWSDVVRDTDVNLYIGHANYRQADPNNKNLSWMNPYEISNQLKFNSLCEEVKGSIFFRYKSLIENSNNPVVNNQFINILKKEHFTSKANLPSKIAIAEKKVESPLSLEKVKTSYGNMLIWEDEPSNSSISYLVYRNEVGKNGNELESLVVEKVDRENNNTFIFTDKSADLSKNYIYRVTALDMFNNESEPREEQ
jgi:uncharacterized lipoprotein YddW (UPF0748 family)